MNEPTTIKKSEFVLRRLSESFEQFTDDLWASIPVWLLVLVAIAVVARIVYRYSNAASRAPGSKDPLSSLLGWGMWLSLATLVVWVLVAFYNRESEQSKNTAEQVSVSALDMSNAIKWYSFTIGIFALGAIFVVLMYIKDTRSVRWFWAVPLALLRITVYGILCFVFLLPAMQTWEDTHKQSRVVILLDISPSMNVSDEISAGSEKKQKTRMDIVIDFLTDKDVAFIKRLLEKNPVAIYAFGTRLDESPEMVGQNDTPWEASEWQAFTKYDFRRFVLKGISEEGQLQIKKMPEWDVTNAGTPDWAATWHARREEMANNAGLNDADKELMIKNLDRLDKRIDVARTIALGTNVADSITAAVNRESANMVQGIVVFSDGRSNLGSESSFIELRERANREKIPIYTIAVGVDRQKTEIAITEIVAPDSAPIDEAWRIFVEADGKNLANKVVEVELDLFKPGNVPPKDEDALQKGDMGVPDHTLKADLMFAAGDPPHGQAEFVIDPAKLPEHLTEDSKDAAIKKRVLLEGKWSVRARIKKDDLETYQFAEHIRSRPDISVVQRKLRILLFAGAPGREFGFLRTLLVREVQDKRAELTTYVQNEAGKENKLTKEEGETIIVRFPNRFLLNDKQASDPVERLYNLNEYDVIIAFDPDWSELTQQQAEDLNLWVREGGGGLIYLGGPINSFQLAPGRDVAERAKKLVEILPIIPADIIARDIQPSRTVPRRLKLYPERIIGSELLKLEEDNEENKNDPVAGWELFFTDREKYEPSMDLKQELYPRRGFFSAYPIKELKPGSAVLAELMLETDTGEPFPQPWIVTNNPSHAHRTAFLASTELFRLRTFDPDMGREFHERFWIKLIKYMSGKRNFKAPRGRVLVSKEGVSGTPLRVQARILDETAKPYAFEGPTAINPKFTIIQEAPTGEKRTLDIVDLSPRQTAGGEFDGYYAGQVLLDAKTYPPGDFNYRVEIELPNSPGDKLSGEFRVRLSDPEMDNTRPDFVAMLRMASDFTGELVARASDRAKSDFVTHLPKEGGVTRLAFKIGDKELLRHIPDCMTTQKVETQNRGPINDLWDKGFHMPKVESSNENVQKYLVSWWSGQRLSIVLLVVVFLLSLEWLVRKLLRLA